MLQLYTFLSTSLFLFFLPLIFLLSLLKKKYRGRTLQRLGLTLKKHLPQERSSNTPVIWVHALSVGEVTSALPLIRGLRQRYPQGLLYFSTTTRTGQATAKKLTQDLVDAVFFSPFDVYFATQRFIHLLKPSLFILVETDLWPGWLHRMKKNQIPTLLVNGRFSKKSLATYYRFRFLFRPMFGCFSLVSMQTRQDAEVLNNVGIVAGKITTLGNLKFDAALDKGPQAKEKITRSDVHLPQDGPLLICGSTHRGEEEIILAAYREIKKSLPELCLLIAPRDINRADEIETLARGYDLLTTRRSMQPESAADILLLDTLGELAACYQLADTAFIGGSLVPAGGHNPLEAATYGVPVLFGPFMEDFAEISRDLVLSGGALVVSNRDELVSQTLATLNTRTQATAMGEAAKNFVLENQGVIQRHLAVIEQLLSPSISPGNG